MSEFDELNLHEPFLKGLRNLVSGNQAKPEDLVEISHEIFDFEAMATVTAQRSRYISATIRAATKITPESAYCRLEIAPICTRFYSPSYAKTQKKPSRNQAARLGITILSPLA